jgi:hypothetical protein
MAAHPPRRRPIFPIPVVAAVALVSSCGPEIPDPVSPPPRIDPEKPGLAFTRVPAAAVLNGRFELRVRLNDARGVQLTEDDSTAVTVTASGAGTLGGTLQRISDGGFVRFDDLVYDRWETIALTVRASGHPDSVTPPFEVRPIMRFASMPPARASVETRVGPIDVELVDGQGALCPFDVPVTLDSTDPHVVVAGGRERRFSSGTARFPAVVLQSEGNHTLTWRAPGLGILAHGLMAFAGAKTESLWLRSARVGVPYRVALPGGETSFQLQAGSLPPGLALTDDAGVATIAGTPSAAAFSRFELASTGASGVQSTWLASLDVAPTEDPAGPTLDELDRPGPYQVASFEESVAVPARGVTETVRVYFPRAPTATTDDAAAGPFPLVAFHHGAARLERGVSTLHDRYGPLLERWASHGFVVASVDGISLIYQGGAYLPVTLGNITLISENLRSTIAHLRARNREPTFPLAGQLDLRRIVVAGHSRGAAGAILAAQSKPVVAGMLLIKPVDPMAVMGGEALWNRSLPEQPALLTIAGNDADVIYPIADFLYERRSGPMSAHTILGSLHAWSCDVCPPERGGVAEVTREQDWAVTNAYAVAFLKYVTGQFPEGAGVLFGAAGLTTSLTPLGVVRRSDRGAGVLVDDFQDEAPVNALGRESYAAGMLQSRELAWLGQVAQETPALAQSRRALYMRPDVAAFSRARRLGWSQDGAVYGNALGNLDVEGLAAFAFRMRSEDSGLPAPRVSVRLVDGAGQSATVEGSAAFGRNGVAARFADVIAPLVAFKAQGLDLRQLAAAEILFSGQGAVTVDDLRFE